MDGFFGGDGGIGVLVGKNLDVMNVSNTAERSSGQYTHWSMRQASSLLPSECGIGGAPCRRLCRGDGSPWPAQELSACCTLIWSRQFLLPLVIAVGLNAQGNVHPLRARTARADWVDSATSSQVRNCA